MFGEEFVVHPGEIQISRSTNFRDRMDTVDDRLASIFVPPFDGTIERRRGMEWKRNGLIGRARFETARGVNG